MPSDGVDPKSTFGRRFTGRTVMVIGGALMATLVAALIGAKFYIEKTAKAQVDDEIAKLRPYAAIGYEKLIFNLFQKRFHLQNVQVRPQFIKDQIRIEDVVVDSFENGNRFGENLHFTLDGIYVDPSHADFLKPFIAQLGMPETKAHLECAYTYDRGEAVLTIDPLKLRLDKMGEAELRLRLENLNLDRIRSIPNNIIVLMAAMSGVSIATANIRYRDDALLETLYTVGAQRSGQPVDLFRSRIAEDMDRRIAGETDPATKRILESLRNFLKTPDRLEVSIQPKQPVPLMALYFNRNPKQLIELLDIRVSG